MDIDNLFENTFVISLPHRIDRRLHIEQELSKLPIEYSFCDAINGHELDYSGPLLKGEIGIKQTHDQLLKTAKEQHYNSMFIFEDDVELSDDAIEQIKMALADLPADVDMFYLGASHHQRPRHIAGNIYKVSFTFTAHALYINKTAFDILERFIYAHPHHPLDVCYAYAQSKLNAYAVYPHLAWQMYSYSDIQNKFTDYEFLKSEFVRFENHTPQE
jgi:GR25 family glycosyltransferase involved in LPS biosynthesis